MASDSSYGGYRSASELAKAFVGEIVANKSELEVARGDGGGMATAEAIVAANQGATTAVSGYLKTVENFDLFAVNILAPAMQNLTKNPGEKEAVISAFERCSGHKLSENMLAAVVKSAEASAVATGR